MTKKTEAQKRAQKTYIEKFARIEVRMDVELRDAVQAHAAVHKESMNSFAVRAFVETMQHDNARSEKAGH